MGGDDFLDLFPSAGLHNGMRKSTSPMTVRPGYSVLWEEQMSEVRAKVGSPDLHAGTVLRTALFVLAAMDGESLRTAVSLAMKAEIEARSGGLHLAVGA